MSLKPVLKLKVDELFLHWLSDSDTQRLLKTNLKQIKHGEPLSQPSHGLTPGYNNTKSNTTKPQSPRIRPSSPSTPPCSPSIASPRSPRRAYNKAGQRSNSSKNLKEKEQLGDKAVSLRGDPDGEASNFLRQKEAQLRERREKEKQKETDTKRDSHKTPLTGGATTTTTGNTSSTTSSSATSSASSNQNSVLTNSSKRSSGDSPAATTPHSTSNNNKQSTRLKTNSSNIPSFYFPHGRPEGGAQVENKVSLSIKDAFSKLESNKAKREDMANLVKAGGLPLFWKAPIFVYAGGEKHGHVSLQNFLAAWRKLCTNSHDDASRFIKMTAKPGVSYLEEEDFVPLIQDVVDTHPGLSFLHDSPEFHSRYVQTVISRIFYCVNRSWTGKITVPELRRSNFLQTLRLMEEEDDVNQISDYFSYEHFYVIYCKFWEIDKDHDLYISKEDLAKHNDNALSSRMIERIFSGAVTRNLKDGKMSYKDFVWFLISEEDKRHPTSIEYWFRCMDLDGDGVISMYEMEYFYEEQVQKMEALGIETLPFEDCLCQMLDMVKPRHQGRIMLSDLKNCKMTPLFYDTFFNLDKYLDHEQKDPFANLRDHDSDEPELSDWEKYAAEEYEILVAEEGATDYTSEEIMYEDDFEPEEDEDLPTLNSDPKKDQGQGQTKRPSNNILGKSKTDDDIYDFNTKDLGY